MAEPMYELDLVVGSMITTKPEEDREAYDEEREWLQDVQDLLREEGVEVDLLAQPGVEIWEGGIQSFYDLYQLRRLAAHLERGNDVSAIVNQDLEGEDIDDLLADIWDEEAETRFPHLIKHQGDGGYYLPAEFAEPVWMDYGEDEEDSDMLDGEDTAVSFGSSYGLLRELTDVETLFRDADLPRSGASAALDVLKIAAQQSINTGLPIILW